MTTYTATNVFSNVVSEGCSKEFRGLFITKVPASYKGILEGAKSLHAEVARKRTKTP
jgi:hypothetical protein